MEGTFKPEKPLKKVLVICGYGENADTGISAERLETSPSESLG